jgi:hypothetical protein
MDFTTQHLSLIIQPCSTIAGKTLPLQRSGLNILATSDEIFQYIRAEYPNPALHLVAQELGRPGRGFGTK